MLVTQRVYSSSTLQNRVQEHQSAAPLQLLLPVLTDPAIVQTAVAALYRGKICLSMCTVEAIIVLAHAIEVMSEAFC